ncbi:protein spaetzle 5 isoform X1 [Galleria mellonella]|uniref:Protein spaetzle 5 isoform X1 n=1 Tax=Galleria mellonella TaxID=7137 RepID=A0A6J1WJP5_GALME|nr:protein spaetzle 5 isoform X1 [Galleria mellonella]
MASKMKRYSLHFRTFLLLIWTTTRGGDGYSCPYGQNCGFEPAPPGRAPACAQPGLTYCLYPDPYPEHVIRQLIEAGQYDIRTLLSDESRDDFNSNKKVDYPYGYGPNSLPHVDQISLVNDGIYQKNFNTKYHTRFNHDIFSQKTPLQPPSPADPSPYNINTFQSSNFTKFGFHGYHTSSPGFWNPTHNQFENNYDKKVYRQTAINQNFGFNQNGYSTPNNNAYPNYDSTDWFRQASSGVTHYNPSEWWKYISPSRSDVTVQRSVTFPTRSSTVHRTRRRRNAELVKESAKRTLTGAEALRIALGLASAETSAERPRRQAANTQELCRVRTEYITPRAALNNKGNWRYVVNMPDNMTQLVRAEICTSTDCSGLCSLPSGYSSRCEQKYIQKRLVALEASGQNLYTDIFWIPSCCQCTIIANN